MRRNITVSAKGVTLSQAKAAAYASLKKQFKNNVLVYKLLSAKELSSPQKATKCKTENFPANGARKFITVHNIYAVNPLDKSDILFVERAKSLNAKGEEISDKTTAVKRAKELALANQITYIVKVEKVLENEDEQVTAKVTPSIVEGTWEFVLDIETA